MEWTGAARKAWRAQSRRHSARTLWFTASSLKARKETTATVGDLIFPEAAEAWAEAGAVTAEEDSGTRKKSGRMERKFWNGLRRKAAAVSLRRPKSSRLIKSTAALKKNCATSTGWDSLRIRPTQPAITNCCLRRSRT